MRELVNIDLGRQIAKDAAKSKEWCERNNVKWDGPEELEEFEDFSSEDDLNSLAHFHFSALNVASKQ